MRCLIAAIILLLFSSPAAESERWRSYEKITNITCNNITVDVTWYTSSIEECDDTPYITASGKRVSHGTLAVSVDLFDHFTYGDVVYIEDLGFYTVEDRMNKRWRNRVDIWCEDREVAFRNGIQVKELRWNFRETVRYEEVR